MSSIGRASRRCDRLHHIILIQTNCAVRSRPVAGGFNPTSMTFGGLLARSLASNRPESITPILPAPAQPAPCRCATSQAQRSLSIPWQKPPSKRSRQILLPHNASRSDVRPEQFERRARLVSAIARGRRWLDDVVSGRVTTVAELCAREKCSVRQVNMTISLAFLAPNLVKAAVEGRLPRGIGIERLRDPPTEWSRQFEALGLNPE